MSHTDALLQDPTSRRNRELLADVLSVLAMTLDDKERDCLKFRLLGSNESVASFGHPYIRRLCSQIPNEWNSGGTHVHVHSCIS